VQTYRLIIYGIQYFVDFILVGETADIDGVWPVTTAKE
jgi:hypothetical protein